MLFSTRKTLAKKLKFLPLLTSSVLHNQILHFSHRPFVLELIDFTGCTAQHFSSGTYGNINKIAGSIKLSRQVHYRAKQDARKKAVAQLWYEPEGYDTGIKVYNTQLHDKTALILPHGKLATWYQCGPTVYDIPHIGHAACYVKFDLIRRIMEEFFSIDIVMVMGITDIDDKIIEKSRELNVDFFQLTKKCEAKFFDDMATLKVQMTYF